MSLYQEDLAYIHHAGFGGFSTGAAPGLLALFRKAGIKEGLVVDLGCGSGLWARELLAAGYGALGIDRSPAMIELAREVAPGATFEVASLHDVEIPSCSAVTALGESIGYLPADSSPAQALGGLFTRVARSLQPGGLFIFDLILRSRGRPMQHRGWSAGPDWAVLFDAREDPDAPLLTREITTFRQVESAYRRACETHQVRLYTREEIERELRQAGFSVRVLRRYGTQELLPQRLAFCGRKVSS
jgi:SAM-dependent methyltransferase